MAVPRFLRLLFWFLATLVLLTILVSAALIYVPPPVEHILQDRVLNALRQRYGPSVQLQNLHIIIVPVFRVTLDDFVLPNRGPELPPFITIKHVTAEAVAMQLLRKPVHLSWLKLEGLVIRVPPKNSQPPDQAQPKPKDRLANFVIDRVDADGTVLYILPRHLGQEPMEWDLRTLHLRSAGIGQPMRFTSELTNPKPPGIIRTTGNFGPWNIDNPSETEVSGHYDLKNADLSVFNGISGILSSTGDFTGMLENIFVDGKTDTPHFKLATGARAVHLTTDFHALVDGTNGDTFLQPVKAHFLNSSLTAIGQVVNKPRTKGKTIELDVDIHDATVQDLLELAVASSQPMLTGGIASKARLLIPPGNEEMIRKIQLAGRFQITNARFNSDQTKGTVAALSRRAQGKPKDLTIQDVPADMSGTFALRDASLSFTKLQFSIPGVNADVRGSYALQSGQLDFAGEVLLQAHVSQTMAGPKRILLKPVDPLFARHSAGTYLPVNIKGNRDHPEFKLNLGKVF